MEEAGHDLQVKMEKPKQVKMEEPEPITINDPLVPSPQLSKNAVLVMLQSSGLKLNGVEGDANQFIISFDKPPEADESEADASEGEEVDDPFAQKKVFLNPYIQAPGPSVQIERTGIYQKKECCGYKPPSCENVKIHFRPASPGDGSQAERSFTYDGGDLRRSTGCLCKNVVDSWEFKSDGHGEEQTLVFHRKRVRDPNGKRRCCNPKILPQEGEIWELLKDGKPHASVHIPPKNGKRACHIFCCSRCPPIGCANLPNKPMVWLRVQKAASGETMFAIRDKEEGEKPCTVCCGLCYVDCAPQCDCTKPTCACFSCCRNLLKCCGVCFSCKWCPELCRVCTCFPCCSPLELIPIKADGGGTAEELKKKGATLRLDEEGCLVEKTHDIQLQHPGIPEMPAVPAQEMMVQFKFPGIPCVPAIPGKKEHFGTYCELPQRPTEATLEKYILHCMAVEPGSQVHKDDVVAYMMPSKSCCGIACPGCVCCGVQCGWEVPYCPKEPGCPTPCASCGPRCHKSCSGCALRTCPCLKPCLKPCLTCACCKPGEGCKPGECCREGPEPTFSYEPLPVTGEWANSEKAPEYRVRSEVNATAAIGEAGYLVSDVVAGLQSGATEEEHYAFALVTFMEFIEDARRPTWHTEPGIPASLGLPPRQQKMLGMDDDEEKEEQDEIPQPPPKKDDDEQKVKKDKKRAKRDTKDLNREIPQPPTTKKGR